MIYEVRNYMLCEHSYERPMAGELKINELIRRYIHSVNNVVT